MGHPTADVAVELVVDARENDLFKNVCHAFMKKKCTTSNCPSIHDKKLCLYFWKTGNCKYGQECKKNHFVSIQSKKSTTTSSTTAASQVEVITQKLAATTLHPPASTNRTSRQKSKARAPLLKKTNTECFEPKTTPVDMRIALDLGTHQEQCSTVITSRDVLLVPNLFRDFVPGELYTRLVEEIQACGLNTQRGLKMWHGNATLEGTHYIADDTMRWKQKCPTFQLVIDRIASFFHMQTRATRLNWYKDTSQWKPFHFDAAAMKPALAALQNFTVGVSFGATREAAFEHADTKCTLSIPQSDGCVYAFARETNVTWRHGILQDTPMRDEGRISVISWGWIDEMKEPKYSTGNMEESVR